MQQVSYREDEGVDINQFNHVFRTFNLENDFTQDIFETLADENGFILPEQ